MDPVTGAALLSGLFSFFGGMFSSKSATNQQKRELDDRRRRDRDYRKQYGEWRDHEQTRWEEYMQGQRPAWEQQRALGMGIGGLLGAQSVAPDNMPAPGSAPPQGMRGAGPPPAGGAPMASPAAAGVPPAGAMSPGAMPPGAATAPAPVGQAPMGLMQYLAMARAGQQRQPMAMAR